MASERGVRDASHGGKVVKYPNVWTPAGGCEGGPDSRSGRAGDLVGRAAEVADLRAALDGHRLVTVAGAAGVGKSRLAAAVAGPRAGGPWRAMVRVRWHDGVPIGPGALTARVVRALTAAAGGPPGPRDADATEAASAVSAGGLLLVLDDVDPVHTECAGLVQRLLMAVPALRVLVTARRALGLGDERVVRLAPLAVDCPAGARGPSPAVELFLSRARGGPPLTDDDLPDVTRVCRLLEGVPLAIELAAGQLAEGTVCELATRLETDQCWLTGPGPLLRRHRSLRASLGAVHALCDETVRRVWHRAGVFAGPFTEAAAVQLCSGDGIEPHLVPSCLAVLSAAGVLQVIGEPGVVRPHRYRMTRAARDFGAERLSRAGESQEVLVRHAIHYRGVAAVAETLWNMGLQHQAAQIVLDEHDELMALAGRPQGRTDGSDESAYTTNALEAVLHLWFWWAAHERGAEGSRLLLGLLRHVRTDSPLVARGRWLAAWLLTAQDPWTAQRLLDLAWPTAVMAGDDALLGRIAHVRGTLAWQRRDPEAATRAYREAADTIPEGAAGGPRAAVSLAALSVVQAESSPEAAVRTAHRALARPDNHDDAWAAALAQYALAHADHRAGRTGRALRRVHRTLARLDAEPGAAPQARTALLRLLDHIGRACGTSPETAGVRRPFVPVPRAGAPAPSTAPEDSRQG